MTDGHGALSTKGPQLDHPYIHVSNDALRVAKIGIHHDLSNSRMHCNNQGRARAQAMLDELNSSLPGTNLVMSVDQDCSRARQITYYITQRECSTLVGCFVSGCTHRTRLIAAMRFCPAAFLLTDLRVDHWERIQVCLFYDAKNEALRRWRSSWDRLILERGLLYLFTLWLQDQAFSANP